MGELAEVREGAMNWAEKEALEEESPQEEVAEEEVVEEAAEEAVEEVEAPEEDAAEKRDKVDYGALHAERERRKQAQRELEEIRTKYSTLEERIATINEQIARQNQAPTPTFEENPDEYFRHQLEQTGKSVEELKAEMSKSSEAEQHRLAQQQLAQSIMAAEAEFRRESPDYDDAVNFLREARAREYAIWGIDDPSEINLRLYGEALQLAEHARQAGMSPAQLAYNLASARGYRKAAAQQVGDDASKKLEKVKKGQESSKSLSSRGGEGEPVLDAEALANMSDEEFALAMKRGVWSKVIGQ